MPGSPCAASEGARWSCACAARETGVDRPARSRRRRSSSWTTRDLEAATAAYFGVESVVAAYLPYDYPHAIQAFLEHFRPRLGVLMETEVWPNLLHAAARHGVPNSKAVQEFYEKNLREEFPARPDTHLDAC